MCSLDKVREGVTADKSDKMREKRLALRGTDQKV